MRQPAPDSDAGTAPIFVPCSLGPDVERALDWMTKALAVLDAKGYDLAAIHLDQSIELTREALRETNGERPR